MRSCVPFFLFICSCAHLPRHSSAPDFCHGRILAQNMPASLLLSIEKEQARDSQQEGCKAFILAQIAHKKGQIEKSKDLLQSARKRLTRIAEDLTLEIEDAPQKRLEIPAFDFKADANQLAKRFTRLFSLARYEQISNEAASLNFNFKTLTPLPGWITVAEVMVRARVYKNDLLGGLAYAEELIKYHPQIEEWAALYAWTLAKNNQHKKAASAWKHVYQMTENAELRDSSCFLAGFAFYEFFDYPSAKKQWRSCLLAGPRSDWREKMQWQLALLAVVEKNWREAQIELSSLLAHFSSSKECDKYQYWKGIAFHDESALHELAVRRPYTYYGMLARSQVKASLVKGRLVQSTKWYALAKKEQSKWATDARLLYGLTLERAAIKRVLPHVKENTNAFGLLQEVGGYFHAWRLSHLRLPQQLDHGKLPNALVWRAHYPQAWKEEVSDAAKRFGLSPNFIYAIIHTETGFDAHALSHRGAMGLMQLMPQYAPADDLFDAKRSIELGSQKLALIKNQFDKEYLVAASYNSSEESVAQWIQEFGKLGDALFIERIPYQETRNYVKSVLTARAIYTALEGENLKLFFN